MQVGLRYVYEMVDGKIMFRGLHKQTENDLYYNHDLVSERWQTIFNTTAKDPSVKPDKQLIEMLHSKAGAERVYKKSVTK